MNYHGLMSSVCNLCSTDGLSVDRNRENYFIAITLWFGVLNDCQIDTSKLQNYLQTHGLAATIRSCDRIAEWLVAKDVQLEAADLLNPLYFEVYARVGQPNVLKTRNALRFLRRFSPDTEGKFSDEAAKSFLAVQKEMKRYNYLLRTGVEGTAKDYFRSPYQSHVRRINLELSRLLQLHDPVLYDRFFHTRSVKLPDGNCQEARHGAAEKLIALEASEPFSDVLPGLPGVTITVQEPTRFNGQLCSTVSFVNKDYKSARTIAVESVHTYYHAQDAAKLIKDIIAIINTNYINNDGSIPINVDQADAQRDRCERAAKEGSLATYDFTAASDRICLELVRGILGPQAYEYVSKYVSRYGVIRHDGKQQTVKLHSFSTMGSLVTFPLECLIFYLVARYALWEDNNFLGDYWSSEYNEISFHGDDGIMPVVDPEAFTRFGFKPNVSKSFWGINRCEFRFREACGVECFSNGQLLMSYMPIYISRDHLYTRSRVITVKDQKGKEVDKVINGHINFTALISLRCRAYQNDWFSTVRVIDRLLLDEGIKIYYADPDFCQLELENEDFMGVFPRVDDSQLTGYTSPYKQLPVFRPEGYMGADGKLHQLSPHEFFEAVYRPIRYSYKEQLLYKAPLEEELTAQRIRYAQFLEHGPYHEEPLDKLLGVSSYQPWKDYLYGKSDREVTGISRLMAGCIKGNSKVYTL